MSGQSVHVGEDRSRPRHARRSRAAGVYLAATIAAAVALGVVPATAASSPAPPCLATARLTALGLASRATTSRDGVAYTMWSGSIASWDGVPLAVDLTVPADRSCGLPLVSMNHGWMGSKADWENPTASATGFKYRFNNVWFASRGYAVLTSTARGFNDSCGPKASSDGTPAGLPAACTLGGRHYWIQLDDIRYSLRDQQWLLARLVDAGVADPDRLAVTGGSMGGALSWMAALANDRVVCGGVGWDPANGLDPCAGVADGRVVRWRSPEGTPLHIAAAVPMFGWASLVDVLLPNGRATGRLATAASPASQASLREPVGVPVQSSVSLFDQTGRATGFYPPPSTHDGVSDWGRWFAALAQPVNTVTARTTGYGSALAVATKQWADYKSPLSSLLAVDARVPVLALHGLTDGIIGSVEAELLWAKLKAYAPDYPVGLLLADAGHAPAANEPEVLTLLAGRSFAFLDHVLQHRGAAPRLDVTAVRSRCHPDSAGPLVTYSAASVGALAGDALELGSTLPKTTSSRGGGEESKALGQANLAACPRLRATTDPGVAAWSYHVDRPVTLAGSPTVQLTVRSTADDAELNVRLWDVRADGMQSLVSRGTYRLATPAGTRATVTFDTSANVWRVPAGDVLKLEVTGYDAPHFQQDAIDATTTVESARLHLPVLAG